MDKTDPNQFVIASLASNVASGLLALGYEIDTVAGTAVRIARQIWEVAGAEPIVSDE